MKITIIGTGYVGLVTGVCFAQLGHEVTCCDVVKEKVDLVNSGKSPIFEPKLEDLLKQALKKGNLKATTDILGSIPDSDISFICVGTPSNPDGTINLEYIKSAASMIAEGLKKTDKFHVITVKSTVVPGTTESLIPILKKSGKKFGLCMNPEFLKEGSAVDDFMNPDRIVIGAIDDDSFKVLEKVYAQVKCPKIRTDLRTAEMIKYTANSFLATKISFINEIANFCEKLGIDIYKVVEGIGYDQRIGRHFLRAGAGFGGSCFPKDVKALVAHAENNNFRLQILGSVLEVNKHQPLRMIELAKKIYPSLTGLKISILGLAFKPDTDDIREAPALPVIDALLKEGASISVYDPQAMENVRKIYGSKISYSQDPASCISGSDLCLILTDWKQFKELPPSVFKSMKKPVVVDGRRTFEPETLIKSGIKYLGIGWRNQ